MGRRCVRIRCRSSAGRRSSGWGCGMRGGGRSLSLRWGWGGGEGRCRSSGVTSEAAEMEIRDFRGIKYGTVHHILDSQICYRVLVITIHIKISQCVGFMEPGTFEGLGKD